MAPPISAWRLPHHILAEIFQYLSLRDILSCMQVCRNWYFFLELGDTKIWEIFCEKLLPEAAANDPYLLTETPTYKERIRAFCHAWNPADCSRNAYIKTNAFTMHRNPIAQSTDGVRSKLGFNSGRHAWEVWWEGPLGTVAVVGVATKHAALQCPGYLPLLGSDDQGWGWNLVDNTLIHNNESVRKFPDEETTFKYQVGDKIRVILDCEEHVLYFEQGYEFLGVGFYDLPPVKLYPCICAVYGNTEISMVYLGPPIDG